MKKFLAVTGIILPFVFGFLWLISFVFLRELAFQEPDLIMSFLSLKAFAGIATIVGLITMVIGIIYLGREKGITHKEIFTESRNLIRKNLWKFSLGIVSLFILQIIQVSLGDPNAPMTIGLTVILFLLGIAYIRIDFGIKKVCLSIIKGKKTKLLDVFVTSNKFLKCFLAYMIIRFFTFIGLILFIVPGIFVGFRLSLTPYLIIEKDINPWQAIKESWILTKGKTSNLFALNIIVAGLNIIGLLAFIVGLFWTIPFMYILNAVFYKKLVLLRSQSNKKAPLLV